MKSKISCFNKTIFKKNLTLYWPIWVAYLLYMIAVVPVSLYQYMHGYYYDPSVRQYSALRNVFEFATEPVTIFAFCVMAVMGVFSYLYTAKNANGIHGLPVTRLELFVTNTVSAFLFLAISELIAFIAGVFVGISCGVTNIEVLLYMFLYQLGITFFGVAFATCVAMLTGHILALPVYCVIANYLYVAIRYVVETLILDLTYGLSDLWGMDASYVLSPIYYLSSVVEANVKYNQTSNVHEGINIEGAGAVGGYAVVGIFLFVLAYRLYRRRQLETAGDIIAVGFMKPIFRFGLGIFGGTTAGLLLSDLFYFETVKYSDERFIIKLVCVIVCNIIGFLAAEMLMQKNFRVFKKHIVIEAFASVAVVAIFMGCIRADVFGLERKLPNADEVVKAYVDFDYPVKYEGQEVEELLAIHQQILDEKESTLDARALDTNSYSATFRYVLKDGTIFTRSYALIIDEEDAFNPETASGKLIAKEAEPERLTQYFLGVNYDTNMYLSGSIYLYDKYQNNYEYRLSEDEIVAIVEALKKDIENGSYANYLLYSLRRNDLNEDEFLNDINVTYYNEEDIIHVQDEYYDLPSFYYEDFYYGYGGMEAVAVETAQSVAFGSKMDTSNFYLTFGKKCTNLVNTLEELGIVDETWHLYTYEEYDALMVDEK